MEFDLPGKILPTHRHPLNGKPVAARIILLLADLQAVRKVAGYLSHSARLFCTFCKCHKINIENLNYRQWEMCQEGEVQAQAEAWRDLVTVTEKESLAWATGVRWTPLHNMPLLKLRMARPGIEPRTLQTYTRCSNHWAIRPLPDEQLTHWYALLSFYNSPMIPFSNIKAETLDSGTSDHVSDYIIRLHNLTPFPNLTHSQLYLSYSARGP